MVCGGEGEIWRSSQSDNEGICPEIEWNRVDHSLKINIEQLASYVIQNDVCYRYELAQLRQQYTFR